MVVWASVFPMIPPIIGFAVYRWHPQQNWAIFLRCCPTRDCDAKSYAQQNNDTWPMFCKQPWCTRHIITNVDNLISSSEPTHSREGGTRSRVLESWQAGFRAGVQIWKCKLKKLLCSDTLMMQVSLINIDIKSLSSFALESAANCHGIATRARCLQALKTSHMSSGVTRGFEGF